MIKSIIALASGILFACQIKAQAPAPVPAWVDPIALDQIPAVNKKQVKNGYYYILSDEQFNTPDRHAYYHYAVTALSEKGLTNVSQLEFSFDPSYQKGLVHSVILRRNGQVIDKTKETKWRELTEEQERNKGILNESRTLYANLSDIRQGDVLEYSYSIIGSNPVFKDYFGYTLWLASSVPVGKLYAKVMVASQVKPSIKYVHTDRKPVVREKGYTEYVWEVNNPEVIREEEYLPVWYTSYPSVQISNIGSWEEVKAHCRTMLQVNDPSPSLLKPVLDSLILPAMSEEEKITSLISFVQGHVRYSGNESGIYSHVPRDPAHVLKNRYGDCKEKSVLLCSMLKQIGIDAYPVLVNTGYGGKISEQNPSLKMFNHCITGFRYQGELFFVDPTITYQRGSFRNRLIPGYEAGMVLDATTKPFEDIPVPKMNKTEILEEFRILESGDTELKVVTVSKGFAADEMRYAFMTNSLADIQENYRTFYNKYSDDIEVMDTLTYVDDEAKNEFTTTEHYRINGFWKVKEVTGSKNIDRDFAPYSLHYKLTFPNEATRKSPLQINYPLEVFQQIKVYHTSGWGVEDRETKEDNRFFTYSYLVNVEGECLSLTYHYVSKTDVIEPKDYADYKAKIEFVDYHMMFNATQKSARDYSGFNWTLLLAIFIGIAGTCFLVYKLYTRPYVSSYSNHYDRIDGWLILLAIGMVLSPLGLVISLIRQYAGEMSIDYAAFYFDVESDYFSPLKGYYTLTVACFNSGFLVFTVFLVVLFFQHKASFRPYFVLFRLFNIVFLLVNVIVLYAVSDDGNVEDRALMLSHTGSLVTFIIVSAIWVPYIWYSDRSRHTFTVPQHALDATSEEDQGMPKV